MLRGAARTLADLPVERVLAARFVRCRVSRARVSGIAADQGHWPRRGRRRC